MNISTVNLLLLASCSHYNKIRSRRRPKTHKRLEQLGDSVDGCSYDLGPDPREDTGPVETPREKLQRVKKEKREALSVRKGFINHAKKLYNIPLRLRHISQALKHYPALRSQHQKNMEEAIERHDKLHTHCIQVNHRGDVEGKSKLLGQTMPWGFYRSHPSSAFHTYRFYHHRGYHPDPVKHLHFVSGDKHHKEHHKEVDGIVGQHIELPRLYQTFKKCLDKEVTSTKQREEEAAAEENKKLKADSFFPMYTLFGRPPRLVYINPAYVPLGSKLDLALVKK